MGAAFLRRSGADLGELRNATNGRNIETYVLAKDEFRAAIEASRSFRDQLYRVYFLRH